MSHANPADNDFTLWLGSRLSAAGYNVWADLNDLKLGIKIWNEIEQKIRQEAVKVLVVTSYASRSAEGVDNEIQIAKGIEKEVESDNFIVQLKIDDLPYSQLPPALNNRLALDFSENWGRGLTKLLKQLSEDGVPLSRAAAKSTELFRQTLTSKQDQIIDKAEPTFANWLPIGLPKNIYVFVFRGSAKVVQTALGGLGIPSSAHQDFLLTFADAETVGYCTEQEPNRINGKSFDSVVWRDSADRMLLPKGTRRQMLNEIVNDAWARKLRSEGFLEYQMANETAYFRPGVPFRQRYRDPLNRRIAPVSLIGETKKHQAYWHAAMSATSSVNPMHHLSIRLHVAFTRDGKHLLADGDRAFKLRKSFCKNFWNPRWRKILFALFELLTDKDGYISISTGGEESIQVGFPLEISAPYTIKSDPANTSDDEDNGSEEDVLELQIFDEMVDVQE